MDHLNTCSDLRLSTAGSLYNWSCQACLGEHINYRSICPIFFINTLNQCAESTWPYPNPIEIASSTLSTTTLSVYQKGSKDVSDNSDDTTKSNKKLRASTTPLVMVICVTVLIGAVIISATVITIVFIMVKKKQRPVIERELVERNGHYGSYDEGPGYNVAQDINPRYNEDGGNTDSVVTDQNMYYCMQES